MCLAPRTERAHIQRFIDGGANTAANLVRLCSICHDCVDVLLRDLFPPDVVSGLRDLAIARHVRLDQFFEHYAAHDGASCVTLLISGLADELLSIGAYHHVERMLALLTVTRHRSDRRSQLWLNVLRAETRRWTGAYDGALSILESLPERDIRFDAKLRFRTLRVAGEAREGRARTDPKFSDHPRLKRAEFIGAYASLDRAVNLSIQRASPHDEAMALSALAAVQSKLGDVDGAITTALHGLRIASFAEDARGVEEHLARLGTYCITIGDLRSAFIYHRRSLAISATLNHRRPMCYRFRYFAQILIVLERFVDALACLQVADSIGSSFHDPNAFAIDQLRGEVRRRLSRRDFQSCEFDAARGMTTIVRRLLMHGL